MKSFWQVMKEAMQIQEAQYCAIISIVSLIASAFIPFVVHNDNLQVVAMLVAGFTSMSAVNRLAGYIKTIRTRDLEQARKQTGGKGSGNEKKKNRR
ncbi:MAG: hypothetical protein FWG10_12320 [Eubacteriaceae bacterium]|nr:hypothetical protein [Eubacteriaceae bacterium]